MTENGYVTPKRCTRPLAANLPARDEPILDFACGTGLSGSAAIGALSSGAAPAGYLDVLLARLAPGGLLAFSYNEHTLAMPKYVPHLERALERGVAPERFREAGAHIVKLGMRSTAYVLENLESPR